MNEKRWVKSVVKQIANALAKREPHLTIEAGKKLPYACEIREYDKDGDSQYSTMDYETDILVREWISETQWVPRVVIEAKLRTVTTHDAITYSQKSATHKQVHPYLRYGMLLGDRDEHPLPGRLFRHGAHFDFMISWKGLNPTKDEFKKFIDVLTKEVRASRLLEKIIFRGRGPRRKRFTCLHKPLLLK